MQNPNRLPIFSIALCLASATVGCSLQEVPAMGQECPPTIEHAHDSILFGDIECFADIAKGPKLDENGECPPEDTECKDNLKECRRYQLDFQQLLENEIRTISYTIHEGVASEFDPATNSKYSNACPVKTPSCAWTFTGEKGSGSIESFGCIQCTESICGFECVDMKTNSKHCGKCFNECVGGSTCVDGKCTDNVAGICKSGEHQAIVDGKIECVPDSVDHCGNHETSCRNRDGYLNGACEDGKCIDFECKDGFHVNTETRNCELDTPECCGSNCVACDDPLSPICSNGLCSDNCATGLEKCLDPDTGKLVCANLMEQSKYCGACDSPCLATEESHAEEVFCSKGKCRISRCLPNYHLVNEGSETDLCLPDDVDNCGTAGHSCRVEGWKEGTCVDKKCIPSACAENYHLDKSNPDAPKCVKDSNDCCGESCQSCSGILKCTNGECLSSCKSDQETCVGTDGAEYCAVLSTDTDNCGACGNSCSIANIEGSSQVACVDGKCKATNCKDSHFLYEGECIPNTAEHCGGHAVQCNVANASNYCDTSVKPPKCNFDCNPGFSKSPSGERCNNVSDCNGKDCTQIPGWASGECNNGSCSVNQCKDGFVLTSGICMACEKNETVCGNKCVDKKNDMSHCGACNNSCTVNKVANSTGVDCQNGTCVATHCSPNHYEVDGKCVASTATACGNPPKNCYDNPGVKNASCEDNKCSALSCTDGYRLVSGLCIECDSSTPSTCDNTCVDTNTNDNHCGGCGKTCKTSNFPYATSVACQGGACRIKSCSNTHYLDGNTCRQNDVNNCGAPGKRCNLSDFYGASAVDCLNGKCVATACLRGTLKNGACVEGKCLPSAPVACYDRENNNKLYCCPSSNSTCTNFKLQCFTAVEIEPLIPAL